jgi:hypothetical protein
MVMALGLGVARDGRGLGQYALWHVALMLEGHVPFEGA